MDIRLKTMPYELDGRKLTLCVNMNVLADLQEDCGDMMQMLETRRSMHSFLRLLCAMVNDALDAAGESRRYSVKELGRMVGWKEFRRDSAAVFDLFVASIVDEQAEENTNENEEKNATAAEENRTALTSAGI